MVEFIAPQGNISDAWLETVKAVHARGGRASNVITTVIEPLSDEIEAVRAVVDDLATRGPAGSPIHPTATVAGTIFSPIYVDPGITWSDALSEKDKARVDGAAAELYQGYSNMLPVITRFPGNYSGTYFGRMISYPGKNPGGRNQLAEQIVKLRREFAKSAAIYNKSDISLGIAEPTPFEDAPDGVQTFRPADTSPYGFPCLVHLDLTSLGGRLHLTAVYRHQLLITKAYGNLMGLRDLHRFLGQQSGYPVGELVMVAGMSDSEDYGDKRWRGDDSVEKIIERAEAARG